MEDERVKATLAAMEATKQSIKQLEKNYQLLVSTLPKRYLRSRKAAERKFKHPITGEVRLY